MTIRIHRSMAFIDLVREIKRFDGMLESHAEHLFGQELVKQAKAQKVCAVTRTSIGSVLWLLHYGRTIAGLKGRYLPPESSLENAVCERDIAMRLEHNGYSLDLTTRKNSIVTQSSGEILLILARAKGYDIKALRTIYRQNSESAAYDQIHVYSYQEETEIEERRKSIYTPERQSLPLDPKKIVLKRLPHPTTPPSLTLI